MADVDWHAADREAVLAELDTDRDGLESEAADRRLETHGPNEIETADVVSPVRIFLHQFKSPLIYVLVAAFLVTVAIDHYTDAVVIAAVLVINAAIGFTQEYRAENAMAALSKLVSPKATTLRDGRLREIDSAQLVPGDIVTLESGDLVPADVRLLEATDLRIDNSVLTGESVPVSRGTEPVESEATVADRTNLAYMGTSVVSGRATGVVVATGLDTQIGRIAGEMRRTERAVTPLQQRMHRFGNAIAVAVLAAGLLVFLIGLQQGIAVGAVFLLAVAIAVSAIPEGLPVVMTVALAVSARRMAGRNAIIRRLPAVETLGSCSVIVSDKTGTITQNRMTVRRVWTPEGSYLLESGSGKHPQGGGEAPAFSRDGTGVDIDHERLLAETVLAGTLANEARIEETDDGTTPVGDPTETALLSAGLRVGLDRRELLDSHPQVGQLPFESDRRYAAAAHRFDDGVRTYFKGAPERILELCDDRYVDGETADARLDESEILTAATELANDGLRVLAMARADGDVTGDSDPDGVSFLGLVGMVDPPRPGVREAIESCNRAGIRVLMVTGDHADTARAIAREVGLDADTVLTGTELAELSDAELTERLRETAVLARISPTQKLRVVTLLQAEGETVAVTGDGVNDAPALKAAHIGAAMGISGTDVAKEASEMVLTDDNFATVYAAVEEGRTVFSNIRKATSFLLATGVGLVLAILAAFGLAIGGLLPREPIGAFPLLLLPAQALWLNVVNNGIQDVALAFEPGEPEQFTRPPYDPNAGLLSQTLLERTILVGVVLAVLAVGVFWWVLSGGATLGYAQSAALTTMVVSMAMFVGECRSETRSILEKSPFSNPLLLVGTALALAIHVGALYFGPTQFLLGVEPIRLQTWLLIFVIAPVVILVVEAHKRYRAN
ncbi:Cation transport ATPase [Halalkaliarchaeum sp. AArc-CO]|uniref:cation-translocating P-type ATPase n=1 Tax=unclassified Halalkaliarchaeum TaxID=2678344 RepID=UPI00217D5C30|nr:MULTISPECIES: HAD-IC family P-type ATPase [unclassified Halalkaliarchaeum]MDR5671641.1 HAD-IC family P-type ATPase [Halalkaliarchaeum sp. AArc-GB]UWG51142.1 Cation transport ATPase [Halalkaliarchaeum sp. AArc-CO]